MHKTIEKVKGWARPDSYVTKQDLRELIYDLEKEFLRRTASDFAEACERADLTKENRELKSQVGTLTARNEGLRLQKQILDNISHVGYHPDYVQGLKDQIEDLNVKLAEAQKTREPTPLEVGTALHQQIEQIFAATAAENLNYKEHYEFRLQRCRELEAQVERLEKDLKNRQARHATDVQFSSAACRNYRITIEKLRKRLDQALMHKAPGSEKEVEALQQINAAILDVVTAQKDYTHKLEAALGAYGATKAEVEKVQYSVREVPAAYEPRWLDVK